MGVILLILKMIGIVLLSLLGLILLFFLLMMFWPFSYRLMVHKKDEDFNAAFRILWLLGLLTVTVGYDKEADIKVRVLGIPVYKYKIWPTEATDEEEASKETQGGSEEDADTTKTDGEPGLNSGDTSADTQSETFLYDDIPEDGMPLENAATDDEAQENDGDEPTEAELDQEIEERLAEDAEDEFEKLPLHEKIKAFLCKIKEFILKCRQKCYNIRDSILQMVEKAKKVYKNLRYYIKVLQHPSMQPALKKVWKVTKRIVKSIRPRRIKADIHFGTADPASTMKVYGYYCMIYPFYGKKIHFTPYMDEKVFNIDGKVSGRVQLFPMMLAGWSLFADKHVRRMVRLLIREVRKRGGK